MSSLHAAVWYGHDAIVRKLIQAGADINLRDQVSKAKTYCCFIKNIG